MQNEEIHESCVTQEEAEELWSEFQVLCFFSEMMHADLQSRMHVSSTL